MSRGEQMTLRSGSSIRQRLDAGMAAADSLRAAQRDMVDALVEMWPTSAWRARGCPTPVNWLTACGLSLTESRLLARVAELAADHPALRRAVVTGALPLRRAEVLARAVTRERASFLADSIEPLLHLDARTPDDTDFAAAVRYWADRVDEHLAPRSEPRHRLYLSPSLFGSGQIWGELTPSAFETVAAALDAWIQDPDPTDAPHRRTLAERRADALDDLAHFALTHDPDDASADDAWADDTFDDLARVDELDVLLDAGVDAVPDALDAVRGRLRSAEGARRRRACRRTRRRSGVTANVHIDLRTLAGREIDDLVGLRLASDRWGLARRTAERLLCDSALVATLFAGPEIALDATAATEQFTPAQRRALAARDRHCVFPGCTREPRHCDAHHLEPVSHGGPSRISNGALLCRHHHRLIHEHGWSLHHDPRVGWTATDPDATAWTNAPP